MQKIIFGSALFVSLLLIYFYKFALQNVNYLDIFGKQNVNHSVIYHIQNDKTYECFESLLKHNIVEFTELKGLHFKMLTLTTPLQMDRQYLKDTDMNACEDELVYFLPKLQRDELLTMVELFRFFVHVAKISNTTFYLCGGSLVGLTRHNKLPIPWDDDIDVIVSKENLKTFMEAFQDEVELLKNSTKKMFYLTEPKMNYHENGIYKLYDLGQYTAKYKLYNFPFVDVFLYAEFKQDNISYVSDIEGSSFRRKFEAGVVLPLIKDKFLGEDVYRPYNITKYLFGDDSYLKSCLSRQYSHKFNKLFANIRENVIKNCSELESFPFHTKV
ncbi:hypothetical protein HELRODRAFT_174476 [Helobdella robusta]|uniref:LicD/FKTN/FKRP nucleotidyltransferase domain-containing protein n=1 Tax=Helobdella robusta TaxID=6412 RepID=T1F859_HELRO|nr:hypothetical protein HELRODRAFT_174476 [Helobdella robusta]ESO01520.1 hypothetical protein HELRODRAFT_174476 [Helobdella robusta]